MNIVSNAWYTADEIAYDLDISLERARELVQSAISKNYPVTFKQPTGDPTGPMEPQISGHAIKDLLGLQR